MKPANLLRASLHVSIFACIIACGAVIVLSDRFEKKSDALTDRFEKQFEATNELRNSIEHLSDEIQYSAPADLGHKHSDVREFIVRSNLAEVRNPIIFVGDSITETARLPASLCGHPVVNAGLGGSTSRSYLSFAAGLLSELKAPLIVVALGSNDAQIAARKGQPFAKSYEAMIDFLKPHAETLVLVGIPPFEMDKPLAGGYFDKAASEENNEIVKAAAKTYAAQFADVRSAMNGEHLTIDGVHLTPKGYSEWMMAVSAAITRALHCHAASN